MTFFRSKQLSLAASLSTQRQSQASAKLEAVDRTDENAGPMAKLSLRKQLIELREDRTNYDMLFARFNGLQHKQRLLEEDRQKMKAQFEARQRESLRELESLQAELAGVKEKNEAREREIEALKENNERMIGRMAGYEDQIRENTALREKEETTQLQERAVCEELVREKGRLEEEQRTLQRKLEETEEEVAEVEGQLRALAKSEKELQEEIGGLMLEIKKQEGQRSTLEAAAERQNEFLRSKLEEREALEIRLAQAEKQLDEQLAQAQQAQESIRQMQGDLSVTDARLAETEAQVQEMEQKWTEVARQKETKDLEIIDQNRLLKQLDVELGTRDADLREQAQAYEAMLAFSERMLRQLEAFETENREVAQMVGNSEEIETAIERFDGVIAECRDFLAAL